MIKKSAFFIIGFLWLPNVAVAMNRDRLGEDSKEIIFISVLMVPSCEQKSFEIAASMPFNNIMNFIKTEIACSQQLDENKIQVFTQLSGPWIYQLKKSLSLRGGVQITEQEKPISHWVPAGVTIPCIAFVDAQKSSL